MVAFKKFFKDFKNEHVLGIVGLVFLVFALCQYSNNKNIFQSGMASMASPNAAVAPNRGNANKAPGKVVGASGQTAYAPYNGAAQPASNSLTRSEGMNKPVANPADLLPADSNSSWASMNPVGDLQNINLLNPQQVVGINTQGSSLRNANLQLRSEPPNPRSNTNCPWNISTIEDDKLRKSLEIGTGA
tara:strand:+ start:1836 stop:2399 length:564 start_codon:yes stop_codon:yes gene_type:complete